MFWKKVLSKFLDSLCVIFQILLRMPSIYFLMSYICFRKRTYFQNCILFAYQMLYFSLCSIFSFSVCMYVSEEPSGLVLKFKQNNMDDFSFLVSLMLQNQIIIRTVQVTVNSGEELLGTSLHYLLIQQANGIGE